MRTGGCTQIDLTDAEWLVDVPSIPHPGGYGPNSLRQAAARCRGEHAPRLFIRRRRIAMIPFAPSADRRPPRRTGTSGCSVANSLSGSVKRFPGR